MKNEYSSLKETKDKLLMDKENYIKHFEKLDDQKTKEISS